MNTILIMSFWSHFKTPSKPNQLPRSKAEIQRVEIPIPIYAIGGITEKRFLNYLMVLKEFVRFLFMNASLQQIELLRKGVVERCMMF